MPIFLSRRDDYELTQSWPDTMSVQWGGHGVVLGKQPYTTAFFEVFPVEGGFIRGEGSSIADAEVAAFKKWRRAEDCSEDGGHRWSRVRRGKKPETYTNGGCFCIRCGTFRSVMKPIPVLGEWKEPLSVMALELILMGTCRRHDKFAVRLKLKAKIAGIDLPDDDDPNYDEKCRTAVRVFYHENMDKIVPKGGGGMSGLMEGLALRHLREF